MSQPYVGNYSYSINDLETSSKKRYLMAGQKGKPVLDEELSEVNFRNFDLKRRIWERNAGDAALGRDSFEIVQSSTTTVSNFTIKGGTAEDPAVLFIQGYPLLLFGDIEYNQQNNTGALTDDDYTETLIPGISTPTSDRTDTVYVDCYLAEVSSETGSEYQDPAIKDAVLGLQTANRFRIVQDIRVEEGSTTIPIDGVDGNGIYHRYYKLAELDRHNGVPDIYTADITDMRTVTTSLKEISNGYGDIHVRNAIVDNDLDVHGTLTIINTSETNQEKLVITCNDPGVVAMVVNKSENGDAVQINKTSGTGYALIVNSGYVGINTSAPSEALFIHQQRLGILGSNGAQIRLSGNDHTAGALYTTNNYPLYLGVNNIAERIVIAATTGYVGIHTTNPSNELDVNGTIRIRGGLPAAGNLLQSDATGVGTWVSQSSIDDNDWVESGNDVYFNKSGNVGINTSSPSNAKLDVNGQIRMRTDAASGKIIISDANGVMSWVSQTAISDGDWVVSGSNVYNNTGNIGIGTSNPTKKFAVQAAASDGMYLWNSSSAERGKLAFDASSNAVLELRNAAGNPQVLLDSSTGANYIFAGDTGIGTATPGAKLDVEGNFRVLNGTTINEFSTDGTLAGDSDDAVPTEKAVKTYIDQYSHWIKTSTTVHLQTGSNNVGIGTASSTYKLRVEGTSYLNGSTDIKGDLTITDQDSTDVIVKMYDSGDDGVIDVYQNNAVTTKIHGNGTSYFKGGSVGIGTETPATTLDVEGTLRVLNGTSINEFSTDGTMAGDSDDAVPTEKAVRTYVTSNAGQWNRISSVLSPKTITDGVSVGQTAGVANTLSVNGRVSVTGTSTTQSAIYSIAGGPGAAVQAVQDNANGYAIESNASDTTGYNLYCKSGASLKHYLKGNGEAYFDFSVGVGTTPPGYGGAFIAGTSTTNPAMFIYGVGGGLRVIATTGAGFTYEGWDSTLGRTFTVSNAGQIKSDYGAAVYSPADFAEWTKVEGELKNYDLGTIVSQSDIDLTVKVADDVESVYGIVTDRATFLGGLTGVVKKEYDILEDHQIERKFNAKKIAMTGHVVVKVIGNIKVGQRLTLSSIHGVAKAAKTTEEKMFAFAFARQNYNADEIGLIEVRLL